MPVYNEEKYLVRCLESIIRQSYTDIEIILVDDGSTDSSSKICDEYALVDHRIQVIHTTNGGVSSARNKGLDVATGDYIYFVDSDDVISHNAIRILVDLISGYDMAFAGHIIYETNGKESVRWNDKKIGPHKWNHDDALMLMFDCSALKGHKQRFCYIGYCVNKLYRRNIIAEAKIRFDKDVYYNEDRLFVIKYLMNCYKIISTSKITYKYIKNMDSGKKTDIVTKSDLLARELTEFTAFEHMLSLLQHKNSYYACIYTSFKRSVKLYIKNINFNYENKYIVNSIVKKCAKRMINNKDYFKFIYVLIANCFVYKEQLLSSSTGTTRDNSVK